MDETTRGFYDGDPEGYSETTRWNDVTALTGRFISHLPHGARILDLGCGSGRDTLAFRRLGFHVVPVDGSEGMCRIASESTGSEVRRLDFLDLDYVDEFDGVWACASLLHLRPEEIPEELKAIDQRLKRVSDLQCFDGCSDELGEDELELVTAAGGSNPYKDFIKRINNKND